MSMIDGGGSFEIIENKSREVRGREMARLVWSTARKSNDFSSKLCLYYSFTRR